MKRLMPFAALVFGVALLATSGAVAGEKKAAKACCGAEKATYTSGCEVGNKMFFGNCCAIGCTVEVVKAKECCGAKSAYVPGCEVGNGGFFAHSCGSHAKGASSCCGAK